MVKLLLVVIILCGAALLSYLVSRLRTGLWMLSYVVGGTILLVLNMNKYVPSLLSHRLYDIFCYGRRDFVWLGVAAISVIIGCYPRLKRKNLRVLTLIFLCVTLLRYSLLPFLHPALAYANAGEYRHTQNPQPALQQIVHLQLTEYTCGPAALLTALNRFGIRDHEENIAMRTFANPYSGTQPEHLVKYVNTLYGRTLNAKFTNYIRDIEQLDQADSVFLTITSSGLFTDHYVVVLGFAFDGDLVLADPSCGMQKVSRADFLKRWRHQVITITQKTPDPNLS